MPSAKHITILFPGGGAHYKGMGRLFFDQHEVFRRTFQEAADILHMNLENICFDMEEAQLSAMHHSQVAIYAVSIGMYRVFNEMYAIKPGSMAGHSLGEYAALTAAGAITFADGLRMVQKRGELLHRVGLEKQGRMMAVNGLGFDECMPLLHATQQAGEIYIANYNSPEQFIFSGDQYTIEAMEKSVTGAGAQARVLNIPTCSHCPMMADGAQEFEKYLPSFEFGLPAVPVYANINGKAYTQSDSIPHVLSNHLLHPVLWEQGIRNMTAGGTELFIEMGPQTILTRLHNYIDDMPAMVAFDDMADRMLLAPYFEKKYYRRGYDFIDRCLATAVSYPAAPGSNTALQKEVSETYIALQNTRQQLQDASSGEKEILSDSNEYLRRILTLKGMALPQQEAIMAALPHY